jgi:hypothetical protein
MVVTSTSFTIAEYCEQMQAGRIIINRNYQRSSKVWPPAARSYLIDTILCGYSIPKLSLYQITDLKTRQTIKEIVDGQQRSRAILDFFEDKLRLTSNSAFSGATYTKLEETLQQKFVSYQLSVSLIPMSVEVEVYPLTCVIFAPRDAGNISSCSLEHIYDGENCLEKSERPSTR